MKYTEGFDVFWDAYPRKVKKIYCEKIWDKLRPDKEILEKMLESINWQKKTEDWTKDKGKWIPHPSSFLNAGRWNDVKMEEEDTAKVILCACGCGQVPVFGRRRIVGTRTFASEECRKKVLGW